MASVEDVLADARRFGFLGPGAVEQHLRHAEAFAAHLDPWPGVGVDLGCGGGVPGLVLAGLGAGRWLLVEAMAKRASFLRRAVRQLGLRNVEVLHGRAEVVVHHHAHAADAVVARGFGPPATTAEAAAPFLQVGGLLVVSEPPGGQVARWPAAGLGKIGMALEAVAPGPPAFARIRQVDPVPPGYPRPLGHLTKRPLW